MEEIEITLEEYKESIKDLPYEEYLNNLAQYMSNKYHWRKEI